MKGRVKGRVVEGRYAPLGIRIGGFESWQHHFLMTASLRLNMLIYEMGSVTSAMFVSKTDWEKAGDVDMFRQ